VHQERPDRNPAHHRPVAERRGEHWQTAITQQGLDTLYRLLRKTARKNTAVACHWIRGKDHTELLWIVGDASQFNAQGPCPPIPPGAMCCAVRARTTGTAFSAFIWSPPWRPCCMIWQGISVVSGRLRAHGIVGRNLYRHEWVSLRLFQAFVGDDDEVWLARLGNPTAEDDAAGTPKLLSCGMALILPPGATSPLPGFRLLPAPWAGSS
jgi:CRISPR-associated endonuclease/helicase Cas3